MPHHWYHHGQPVPPPLPPRNPAQNHTAQANASGDPSSPPIPPRPPGYGLGAGLSPSGLPPGVFPPPPVSPNKRPYQYPPPPPGPPPAHAGHSQSIPPLPPRPATSSPHIGPRNHARIHSPPSGSPITPGSAGFPFPPPPPRSPQLYSFTPGQQSQHSRVNLQDDARTSSPVSPPYVTPDQGPSASSVPASPPPPYSAFASQDTASVPGEPAQPPRSASIHSHSQIASPQTSNSAPISPLPQPSRANTTTETQPSPVPGTNSTGSPTPVSPSEAADNLDALLQSLSVEFSIPSPATAALPDEAVPNDGEGPSSPVTGAPISPLVPQKTPLPHPNPSSANIQNISGSSAHGQYRTTSQGAQPSSPMGNYRSGSTSPAPQTSPNSCPYPVTDDKTPAQPPLPLFMERYAQINNPKPAPPKTFKAYKPDGEVLAPVQDKLEDSKQYSSYKPDQSGTNPHATSSADGKPEPTEAKSSFGPLRPVTMLFDPYKQHRAGTAQEPPAVARCIDSPVTFTADWYWHPDVPEFLVCSRCYVDHVFKTKFRSFFDSKTIEGDGTARVCSFSHPRMRDHLFKRSVSTGSMNEALDWMQMRAAIPDCRGMLGIRGSESSGLVWYKPRQNDAIPGFICCQACYEDRLMCYPALALQNFEQSVQQQPQDHWACDLSSPFLQREYEKFGERTTNSGAAGRASAGDHWQNFCREAQAKLGMPLCGGPQLMSTYRRSWFVPDDTELQGLVLCQTCYCDHVLNTGQEDMWRTAPELSSEAAAGDLVRCGMGVPSIRIAMARAADTGKFGIFWSSVRSIMREKFCDPEGITEGQWYAWRQTDDVKTSSSSEEFRVCGACRVGFFEVLGLSELLTPASTAPATSSSCRTYLCSFNPYHSRFRCHLGLLFETFLTKSITPFTAYLEEYGALPHCPRDNTDGNRTMQEPKPAGKWYGWHDCTICAECYHDFVGKGEHGSLTSSMELHNEPLALTHDESDERQLSSSSSSSSVMCELYSPRMRNLFLSCANSNPPDPTALLHFSSSQRRLVYMETVPQIRSILAQIQNGIEQNRKTSSGNSRITMHDMHKMTSRFCHVPTSPPATKSGHLGTVGNPFGMFTMTPVAGGFGQGFAYRELLIAAQRDRQIWGALLARTTAPGHGPQPPPPHVVLGELERRWRSVE